MFHFMALLPSSMLDSGGRWYLMGLSGQWYLLGLSAKVVNIVPVPAGMYTSIEISTFRTNLNTDRTAIYWPYRLISGNTDRYRKKVFYFILFFIYIFKFNF